MLDCESSLGRMSIVNSDFSGLLLVAIAFVINFIVTPKKLTPVVLDAANQTLNVHLDMESVELTFFSTFYSPIYQLLSF